MKVSEDISLLSKALIEFNKIVPKVIANKSNAYMNFKYSDLANILETIRPSLVASGLCVTQLIDTVVKEGNEKGNIITILLHESGQFIMSETPFNLGGKPQEQGAIITYFRRYSLCSILSLTTEGDLDDIVPERKERTDEVVKPHTDIKERAKNLAAEIDGETGQMSLTQFKRLETKWRLEINKIIDDAGDEGLPYEWIEKLQKKLEKKSRERTEEGR